MTAGWHRVDHVYADPPRWYNRLESMLGGGVAFHTAFLVLGAGRLLGLHLEGPAAIVPWLLPTIAGVPASEICGVLPPEVR